MSNVKLNKDGNHLEYDGTNWKITYNETSVMLKKREVKKGGISETTREDFCEHPKLLKEKLDDGFKMVNKPFNWKHIVEEKHNLNGGINKKRRETNLQAAGVNGEGKIYTDEQPDNAVTETEGKVNMADSFKNLFSKGLTASRIILYATIGLLILIAIWVIATMVRK